MNENIPDLLRGLGYRFSGLDQQRREQVFYRPLGQNAYPRFHLYLKEDQKENLFFSIHLDQKRPIYQGVSAHSGEYEGELVEEEIKRINSLFERYGKQ